MRGWWFLAIALAQTVGAAFQSQDAGALEEIRSEFKLPGLGAIRTRQTETQKEVVGVRKLGDPTKIQYSDKFHLSSLSTTMTATVIGILVDEGLLDWDTPLSEALPDFAEILAPGHRNTTIAMVATHLSGIAGWFGEGFLERIYGLTAVEGRNLIITRFLGQEPLATPGQYYYDTTNYIVLARILETFANEDAETWEDIITSRLFSPLNMECGFGIPPESSNSSVDNPWGHHITHSDGPATPIGGPLLKRDNPPAFHPASIIHCDMVSFAAYTQLHVDGFNGLPTSLNISDATFQKLHTRPYPSSSNTTNGGWVYQDGSQSPWSNGPTLEYTGTNFMHFATVILAPKLGGEEGQSQGEALAAFTNIGDAAESGEDKPGGEAMDAVLSSIINGTLFP